MNRPVSNNIPFEPFDSATRSRFRRQLKAWYSKRARDLPWRKTGDAYRIWISEIMLQQTTVTTVVPYFERFINRFPTIHELAAAEQDEVLRHWEGLGYYSRARNIHKTAGLLVEQTDGEFPRTVEGLTALPGIGRYTAGAILSFAFDLPGAIVEANTLRLYSRLLCLEDDPRATRGQRALWGFAEHLLPRKDIGAFNQALMDLGAMVCTPTEPKCDECPVLSACRALASGRQHDVPLAAKKPEITDVIEVSVAICNDDRFLLRRNPEGQRWAGLWDFVRFPLGDAEGLVPIDGLKSRSAIPAKLVAHVEQSVEQFTGANASVDRFMKELRHSVTRYRIQLLCFLASVAEPLPESTDDLLWVSSSELDDFPLSTTGRKFAVLLQKQQPSLF